MPNLTPLLSFVVLASLMLAVGILNFGPIFKEAGFRGLGISLMIAFCFLGLPSFFAVVNFVVAEPASQIRANGYDIPSDWTAGVMNHGSYFRWYTIEEHPALFILSLVALITTVVSLQALLLYSMIKRKRKAS